MKNEHIESIFMSSHCHCEQSEAILSRLPRRDVPRNDKNGGLPRAKALAMTPGCEGGRSLTEMLGMLAIMGILSVAGIAMYNSAMNKHRANELIYEAQKRATTVAMQATIGRDTFSVAEFPNPEGYLFDVKNWNDTQFAITLTRADGSNIDANLCAQIKSAVGPATILREVRQNCTHFLYNKDLSATFNNAKACTADAQCDTDWEHCDNGFCLPRCQSWEAEGSTSAYGPYLCYSAPSQCDECTSNQYCEITGDLYHPTNAACQPLPELQKKILPKATQGQTTAYFAGCGFTYWSAKNVCENYGKKIISAKSLDIAVTKLKCITDCKNTDNQDIPDSYWQNLTEILSDGVFWTNQSTFAQHWVLLLGQDSVNDSGAHIRYHNDNRNGACVLCE